MLHFIPGLTCRRNGRAAPCAAARPTGRVLRRAGQQKACNSPGLPTRACLSHRRTGRGATSITARSSTGTAGSRHTWPRGSQCVHIGQPGSKMRTILRHIQRAYFRRNRRTGGGARSITVHSRRCLPQPRHCTHQAHRAWTRRRHCSETAKRSGLVPGIHSQSTFLHSRFAAGRMGATVQKEIHVDFWRFSYNFSFKRKFESEEGAWTSFDSTHTTGDLIHYDPQHKPRRG